MKRAESIVDDPDTGKGFFDLFQNNHFLYQLYHLIGMTTTGRKKFISFFGKFHPEKGVNKIGKQKRHRRVLLVLLVMIIFIYFNNSSFGVRTVRKPPYLVAHRGVHQTFPLTGIQWDTNTAVRIYEPEHAYLENTLPSIAAAFAAGADLVELDLQLTKDGQFAVFHDHRLDYRTNGQGRVGDYTMAELKKLDIGYGYTADGGETFPFGAPGSD